MARHARVDLCIFCNESPCECNKKPAKVARVPRAEKPVPEKKIKAPSIVKPKIELVAPKAHTDMRAAMREQSKPVAPELVLTVPVSNDAPFVAAILALRSILHPEELIRYVSILGPPKSLSDRRSEWMTKLKVSSGC